MIKHIMIPMAAFAITVSGASAFTGTDWISKLEVDLTDEQVSALERAEEIRQTANDEVKMVLTEAGLDETKMRAIHNAMHEIHRAKHKAMREAVVVEDFEAWKEAAADTPLSEKIMSEADFSKLVEAHELRESGDHEAAEELLAELGLERKGGMGMGGGVGRGMMRH